MDTSKGNKARRPEYSDQIRLIQTKILSRYVPYSLVHLLYDRRLKVDQVDHSRPCRWCEGPYSR